MTIPRARDGWDRRALGAVLALTVFAAFGRFPWLTAEDLWFDEVFSVVLASQDLGELLRRAVADQTNPPGFYLLLWGWVRLGSVDEGCPTQHKQNAYESKNYFDHIQEV